MSEDTKYSGGQGQVVSPETFRDSVGTMDQSGKRKWVYPRKPRGRYTNYRYLVSIILLIIYFGIPFVEINGNPLLLINVLDREFYIAGKPFYPQDFFILALGAIASMQAVQFTHSSCWPSRISMPVGHTTTHWLQAIQSPFPAARLSSPLRHFARFSPRLKS